MQNQLLYKSDRIAGMRFPKSLRLWGLGLFLATLPLLTLVFLRKPVTLVVDDQPYQLQTYALTVKGLLSAADIQIGADDFINPGLNTRLHKGGQVVILRAAQIQISVDGQTHNMLSAERIPVVILAEAGVNLGPGDQLIADGLLTSLDAMLPPGRAHSLQVRRASTILLEENGESISFISAASTLGGALWEQGIRIYDSDQLDPSPDTPLTGSTISVKLTRARELVIQTQANNIHTRSVGPTVGAALADSDLALQGLDFSLPPESAPLPEDGIIKIVRVREEVLLEQAPLPFGATQQALPDVEIDTIQIVSAGEYGLTAQRVRVIYEAHPDEQGWQEIERQVEAEWVAREPQPRVIGYGTKIVIRTENVGGTAIEYWRKVEVYASTYSPCRLGIPDYCSTTTSSGAQLQKGMIATTIEWYRYMKGLPVFVPNYGFATIEDVGGGLPDRHWVDLGYSEEDFVGWAGWTTIYFLTPVPGNILYILEYGG